MILKKLHWYHSFKTEKIEAFTVSYHSLIPKWYSFSDIKKMNNSFNNRLDQGGFDGVYELREVARWSSCGSKSPH